MHNEERHDCAAKYCTCPTCSRHRYLEAAHRTEVQRLKARQTRAILRTADGASKGVSIPNDCEPPIHIYTLLIAPVASFTRESIWTEQPLHRKYRLSTETSGPRGYPVYHEVINH